jgi:hypothetical protein
VRGKTSWSEIDRLQSVRLSPPSGDAAIDQNILNRRSKCEADHDALIQALSMAGKSIEPEEDWH